MRSVSSRTSVILDKELKSKLLMLSQALNADMGEIIRRSIRVFYEYTKKYAIETNNKKILRLLELAEDKELWDTEAKVEDVEKYALDKIEKGETLPPDKTGLE